MAADLGVGPTVGVSAGAEVRVNVGTGVFVSVETSAGFGSLVVSGVLSIQPEQLLAEHHVVAVDFTPVGCGVAGSWQLKASAIIPEANIAEICFICPYSPQSIPRDLIHPGKLDGHVGILAFYFLVP